MAHITWEDRSQYFEQIRARIAEMPQVIEAGISTNATPPSNENQTSIEILGSTLEEKPEVRLNLVSPEYFSLLRIPLKMGRVWDHAETMHGAPLAVTYQTMARAYCP